MQVDEAPRNDVSGRCVFVLDEDEVTRAALQFMLPGDIELHEAASIEAALAIGRQRQPHLVVVSALLVARSNLVLPHQLRAVWPGLKVIVICESAEDDCLPAALSAGADDALMRPFNAESVRRQVDCLLGPTRVDSETSSTQEHQSASAAD